jgi:hypothetical protein
VYIVQVFVGEENPSWIDIQSRDSGKWCQCNRSQGQSSCGKVYIVKVFVGEENPLWIDIVVVVVVVIIIVVVVINYYHYYYY